jgi:hypothetical protein
MSATAEEVVLKIAGDAAGAKAAVKETEDALSKTLAGALDTAKDKASEFGEHFMGLIEHPAEAVKALASAIGEQLVGAIEEAGAVGEVAAAGLAGVAAAVVGVGAAVFGLAEHAAHAAEGALEFSQKTGIAVENVGKLEFAAKAAGGNLGDLTAILKKVELGAAADQGGKFAAALGDIGINAEAFKKMDSEQQLLALANGFRDGAKSGNDMADAQILMGKTGADHLPMLRKMTDELVESGKTLGVQYSQENTKAAEEFGVSMNTIETVLGNVATKIGLAVLPAVAELVEGFAKSPAFMNGVTEAAHLLAEGLGIAVEVVGRLAQGAIDLLAPFVAFGTFLTTMLVEAVKVVIGWIEQFVGSFQKFDSVNAVVGVMSSVFTAMKNTVVTALTEMLGWLEKIPGIGPMIQKAVDNASASFHGMTGAAASVGAVTDKVAGALLGMGHAADTAGEAQDHANTTHGEGAALAAKHAKAIDDLVAALEGEGKKTADAAQAIERVIAAGDDDIDVKARVVAAIEKLQKAHVPLSDAMQHYLDQNYELTTAGKKWADAQGRVNELVDDATASVGATDAATTQYAKNLIDLGASTKDVATLTGLTAGQVKQLGQEMKDSAKAADEAAKLTDEAAAIEKKASGDTLTAKLADITTWYDAKVAALDKSKADEKARALELAALDRDRLAKTEEVENAFAVKKTAGYQKAIEEYQAYQDKIDEATLSGTDLKLKQIDVSEAAALAAAEKEAGANTGLYALLKGKIDEYYQHQRDLANGTADTIVERMHAAGIETAADLDTQTANALRDYQQMADSGEYTAEQLGQAWDTYVNAKLKQTPDYLSGIGNQLVQLAGSFTGSMGSIVGATGGMIQAFSQAQQTALRMNSSVGVAGPLFSSTASTAQKWGSAVSSGASVASGAMDVWNSTADKGTKSAGALAGAMSGAKAGAAFGPYGMAIGAAAGAIVGLVRNMDAGRKSVEKFAESFGGFDQLHEKLLALGSDGEKMWVQLTQKTKGDDLAGAQAEIQKITDTLNSADGQMKILAATITKGGTEATAAMDALDKKFADFVTTGTDGTGLLSKGLVDVIKKEDELGVSTANVAKYRQGQMAAAEDGIASAVKVTSDAYAAQQTDLKTLDDLHAQYAKATSDDERNKIQAAIKQTTEDLTTQRGILAATAIQSQEEASAVAATEIAAVDAKVAAGETWIQAVLEQKAEIVGLGDELKQTGFDGGAAFDLIRGEVDLASNKIAGPALTAMEGYTKAVVGLNNSGHLTQDMYAGLEGKISQTQQAIEAQGFSHDQVMAAMQNDLQTAWELQQRYGYKVDDSTQALINEATQAGLVGEAHKSTTDQMLDATLKMEAAVERLANAIAGPDPKSVAQSLGTVASAADQSFSQVMTKASGATKSVSGIGAAMDSIDWAGFRDDAVGALDDVHDAATAAALGHSPGGVKEIGLELEKAVSAADEASPSIVESLGSIEDHATSTADAVTEIGTSFAAGDKAAANLSSTVESLANSDFSSAMSGVKGLLNGGAGVSDQQIGTLANDVRGTKQKSVEADLAKQIAALEAQKSAVKKGSDDEIAIVHKTDDLKAQLAQAQTQRQADDLHVQYQQVVDKLGPIPAQYAEIYGQTTSAIQSNLSLQQAALAKQRKTELDALGPVPTAYDATYTAAATAVQQKFDLLDAQAAKSAKTQIDAIGPVPDAYEANYKKAFDLVQQKYSVLLGDLGVEPDLGGIPTEFNSTYTAAFNAAKTQLDALTQEQNLSLQAQLDDLKQIPHAFSDAYTQAFSGVIGLYRPFLDKLTLPDWVLHPPEVAKRPAPTHPNDTGPHYGAAPPGAHQNADGTWDWDPPSFATGAFVRSPTLAMIGDALGGEWVLDTPTLRKVAAMAAAVPSAALLSSASAPFPGRDVLERASLTAPIINVSVDASGSIFKDRQAMRELSMEVAQHIAARYRQLAPVGVL